MGRCKELANGSDSWVDEESMRRYENMMQLMTPPSPTDGETPASLTAEEAFISVMGKDRPGRVCCAGSAETLNTWYGSTGASSSAQQKLMEDQLKEQDGRLKLQQEQMDQMRSRLSEMDQMQAKLSEMDQIQARLSEMDQMRAQMQQMSALLSHLQASQAHGGAPPTQDDDETDGDDEIDGDDETDGSTDDYD